MVGIVVMSTVTSDITCTCTYVPILTIVTIMTVVTTVIVLTHCDSRVFNSDVITIVTMVTIVTIVTIVTVVTTMKLCQ